MRDIIILKVWGALGDLHAQRIFKMAGNYESALRAAGCEVLQFEEFGSYQGEWFALVDHGGDLGVVSGRYGSCSGCDAFEAEFGWGEDEESEEYAVRLADFGASYLPPLPVSHYIREYEEKSKGDWFDSEDQEILNKLREWGSQA